MDFHSAPNNGIDLKGKRPHTDSDIENTFWHKMLHILLIRESICHLSYVLCI